MGDRHRLQPAPRSRWRENPRRLPASSRQTYGECVDVAGCGVYASRCQPADTEGLRRGLCPIESDWMRAVYC